MATLHDSNSLQVRFSTLFIQSDALFVDGSKSEDVNLGKCFSIFFNINMFGFHENGNEKRT
ncbi:hypothetical protein MTR_4g009230 [Medicago truncatula]|uniref:Uncharacterized protein n=1 Tax=Medicago truncatula TaxID=3880 RepID=G7JFP4_MEDTR|nr:hypothetical protein MTR_4g009230 [Medicago truncatula]